MSGSEGREQRSSLSLTLVWWDVGSTLDEFGSMNTLNDLGEFVGKMLESKDDRISVMDMPFPAVLSVGLAPIFARSGLWSRGARVETTCYMVISAEDGRILDLGLPVGIENFAPGLFEAPPVESAGSN